MRELLLALTGVEGQYIRVAASAVVGGDSGRVGDRFIGGGSAGAFGGGLGGGGVFGLRGSGAMGAGESGGGAPRRLRDVQLMVDEDAMDRALQQQVGHSSLFVGN